MNKGLTLYVHRSPRFGDSTNGGLSGKVDEITVVNLGKGSEIFEATEKAPAFRLEMHVRGCLRLVPVDAPAGRIGPMFGGNYAATSDSRFGEACRRLLGTDFYGAVAIHDRYETPEHYRALST